MLSYTSKKFIIFIILIVTFCFIPPTESQETQQFTILESMPESAETNANSSPIVQPLAGMGFNVSLNVKDMDIKDVLKILSDKGVLNIIYGPSVGGNVTASLKDVTVQEALDTILNIGNLAYAIEGEVIMVMTQQEYEQRYGRKSIDRKIIKTFDLVYAKPNIINILNTLKSKEGQVVIEERSKKIVVIDIPENIQRMEQVIKDLDVPTVTEIFELKYADPQKLLVSIKQILSPQADVQADLDTRKIIITDIPRSLELARKIIYEYDQAPPTVTEIYDLNYVSIDKAKGQITSEITQGLGRIGSDERNNKIIVTDLTTKLPQIERIITSIDERTRQVLIEAKILQVALNKTHKLGIDWQTLFTETDIPKFDANVNFGILGENEGGTLQVYRTEASGNIYQSLLEALQEVGKTNLLSSPRILAIDREESKILVGKTVPYKTVDTTEQQGVITRYEKVTFIDVGMKLYVTPAISKDGYISMKIKPEVSSATEFRDDVPVVETSQAETNVIIKDGQTIIIAGLVRDNETENISKVPLLGDIPLLKYIFRSKSTIVEKTELVIFLTPHITRWEETQQLTEEPERKQ